MDVARAPLARKEYTRRRHKQSQGTVGPSLGHFWTSKLHLRKMLTPLLSSRRLPGTFSTLLASVRPAANLCRRRGLSCGKMHCLASTRLQNHLLHSILHSASIKASAPIPLSSVYASHALVGRRASHACRLPEPGKPPAVQQSATASHQLGPAGV